MILDVLNDFDFNGLATQDEFSDELCACVASFDGDLTLELVSTEVLDTSETK